VKRVSISPVLAAFKNHRRLTKHKKYFSKDVDFLVIEVAKLKSVVIMVGLKMS
jgi:hypothetical protein